MKYFLYIFMLFSPIFTMAQHLDFAEKFGQNGAGRHYKTILLDQGEKVYLLGTYTGYVFVGDELIHSGQSWGHHHHTRWPYFGSL